MKSPLIPMLAMLLFFIYMIKVNEEQSSINPLKNPKMQAASAAKVADLGKDLKTQVNQKINIKIKKGEYPVFLNNNWKESLVSGLDKKISDYFFELTSEAFLNLVNQGQVDSDGAMVVCQTIIARMQECIKQGFCVPENNNFSNPGPAGLFYMRILTKAVKNMSSIVALSAQEIDEELAWQYMDMFDYKFSSLSQSLLPLIYNPFRTGEFTKKMVGKILEHDGALMAQMLWSIPKIGLAEDMQQWWENNLLATFKEKKSSSVYELLVHSPWNKTSTVKPEEVRKYSNSMGFQVREIINARKDLKQSSGWPYIKHILISKVAIYNHSN